MQNVPLDILFFIGGLVLYGIRNMLGKWLVQNVVIRPLKWLLIRTEHDVKLYMQMRHEAGERRKEKLK
jgi:hypothetical protein